MAINKQIKLYSHFNVEEKAVDSANADEAVYITGYANTVSKDRYGDVIPAYAWNEASLANYKKNPIILAYHDHEEPIGIATELMPDAMGLKITAKISTAAKEVYQLVKEGVLRCFSVGFLVKDAEYDQVTDIFVIKELELLEVSVVSVPANQDSVFDLAKAFDSEEELAEFKKSFIKASSEGEENKGSSEPESTSTDVELNMDKEQLEQLVKSAAEAAATKAAEAAQAAAAKSIEVGQTGAEKLLADVEARFADSQKSFDEALDGLRGELAEKAAEIQSLQKSKMEFQDKQSNDSVTLAEKETAVLAAKALGRKIEDTKAFQGLVQKYGPHVASADWELTISTNMQDEIRKALVIAPKFRGITMPTPVVRLPVNPEAGYATWVQAGQYKTADSSGAEQNHALKELTISAYKLATKEFIGNEEEEDSIIALLPIVRDAMVRRTAKSWDKALLVGAGTAADPIKGLTKYELSANNTTVAVGNAVTTGTLRNLRKGLGVWGLDPSQVIYFVNQDVYFELLEDPLFQTMDKVGSNATILTGQIGSVGGSPVIVSGEMGAKAVGGFGAIAVNVNNFMVGNYKGLRVESDYLVEEQQRILVASLRTGFQQISTVDGQAVSCQRWIA